MRSINLLSNLPSPFQIIEKENGWELLGIVHDS